MLLLLLPLLSLAAAQPGAPWTEEEVLAVKAKLYAMFDQVKASTRQRNFYKCFLRILAKLPPNFSDTSVSSPTR